MPLEFNWLDLIILTVSGFSLLDGWRKGFFVLSLELFSFLGSLFLAFRFYPVIAGFLTLNFSLTYGLANASGFFLTAILAEMILGTIAFSLANLVPKVLSESLLNRLLGFLPAILNTLVITAFFLTLILALPVPGNLKKDVEEAKIGGYLVSQTTELEKRFKDIFGGAVEEAFNFLTVRPRSQEKVDLRFQTTIFVIDEVSERKMFDLVNKERQKRDLRPLVWNPKLLEVARQHSRDMFVRGYFSHYSPEGKDVGDRLSQASIEFQIAGENLAYAPSVTIAHEGLMNSPGHAANILSPEFGQVGIGIIDGGRYGRMFTQVFKD